ncbi:hypothetical protein F66182_7102 [Fusarium sp. NRRL 66182]|nr:hypothetical protein F66182_7102 [Fusarium sp. NRRL 66182]
MTIVLLRSAFRSQSSVLPRIQRRLQSSPPKKSQEAIPVPSTVAPLPLWQRLGPLTTAAQAYARAQSKRPLRTQVATAVVIYICADLSAQFLFLSHHFNYSSRILSIGTKVVVGQVVFTPIFNSYFFGAQALLSGEDIQGTVERVKDTVPTSVVNSCKLWPIVTAFSFTFLPIDWRPLFHGVIAVGWQTYLSFLNRQAELKEALRHEGECKEAASYAVAQAA